MNLLDEFSFNIELNEEASVINKQTNEIHPTITFQRIIQKVYNNDYEKEIAFIYDALRKFNPSEPTDKILISKYYKTVIAMEKEIKMALTDPILEGVSKHNFHDRNMVENRNKPFLNYPSKYACWEDLNLYLGRFQILKNRMNGFSLYVASL